MGATDSNGTAISHAAVCLLSAEEKKKSIPFGRQLTKQSLLSSEAGEAETWKRMDHTFLGSEHSDVGVRLEPANIFLSEF